MSLLSCFAPKQKNQSKHKTDVEEVNGKPDIPPLSNGAANGTATVTEVPAYKVEPEVTGFDTARGHEQPPATAMAQITKPKSKTSHAGKKFDPSQRFVRDLPKHPEYR